MSSAQGFKAGLYGDYLVDLVEKVFTQFGWSTKVECNGGDEGEGEGEAKAKGKKKRDQAAQGCAALFS
jgi:hypothetical protein